MHRVHNNQCPKYISDVVQSLKTESTHERLHSAESTDYVLPQLRAKFTQQGFTYVSPARVYPQNVVHLRQPSSDN